MPLAPWFGIGLAILGVIIAGIALIRWHDARWERKHPGTNDYLARLDNELTEIGE